MPTDYHPEQEYALDLAAGRLALAVVEEHDAHEAIVAWGRKPPQDYERGFAQSNADDSGELICRWLKARRKVKEATITFEQADLDLSVAKGEA